MQALNAILLIRSHIILQGIRQVLLPKDIAVYEIRRDLPSPADIRNWKEKMIVAEAQCLELLTAHYPQLHRNRNIVVGVAAGPEEVSGAWKCDEMLFLTDSAAEVSRKIDRFVPEPQKKKNHDQLTGRETDILRLVAQGMSNKEIADRLFISIHTVISHRKHITEKLNIKTIAGLTLYAVINNLAD